MEHRAISLIDYDLTRVNELLHAGISVAARDQPLLETLSARCGDDEPARPSHRCGDEGGAGLPHCVSGRSSSRCSAHHH